MPQKNNGTKKIRVAVLYGGRSGEHEVSLQSAAAVVHNLDKSRFEVVPIGVDKQGRWFLNDYQQLLDGQISKALPLHTADTTMFAPVTHTHSQQVQAVNTKPFDVVFPVMHGALCEDGTVQGMLELMDVPYVGAGVLASAVGMDKDVSKRLVAAAGIAVPPYIAVKQNTWEKNASAIAQDVATQLGYPVFVKPANTGSSVGVHKVKHAEELSAAVADAFLYDVKILIERGIEAREIELAVLENFASVTEPLVSIPGEIEPQLEFYSYAAKYLDENGAKLLIPAPLQAKQIKDVQALAKQIFMVLECEGMARVDLFLDKKTGHFVFNEVNTIPGFTQISMYPKLWEASGIAYTELLSRLIDLALARHERKQHLKREWAIAT